jgi:hypothetical protein
MHVEAAHTHPVVITFTRLMLLALQKKKTRNAWKGPSVGPHLILLTFLLVSRICVPSTWSFLGKKRMDVGSQILLSCVCGFVFNHISVFERFFVHSFK